MNANLEMADAIRHPIAGLRGMYTHNGRAMWELALSERNPMRDLCVIASTGEHERQQMQEADNYLHIKAPGIRIRDMYCGDWEVSERDAIDLTVNEARWLARALLEAADEYELLPRVNTTPFDLPRAVEAAKEYVKRRGTITFMDLSDHLDGQYGRFSGGETVTLGRYCIRNGVTRRGYRLARNDIVLWNCASPELLAVIDAMLADGRVVLERTSVERYRGGGMVLLEDYNEDQDDYKEVLLPALDFSEEIDPAGYDTPHWVPVIFAWAG